MHHTMSYTVGKMSYLCNGKPVGQAGWGIAWYINNTLVPELVVERGRTYTFLVYGGNVPADDSNYHPFYITNSMNGGRLLNSAQERMVCQYIQVAAWIFV